MVIAMAAATMGPPPSRKNADENQVNCSGKVLK
jgi:hypothetical protein